MHSVDTLSAECSLHKNSLIDSKGSTTEFSLFYIDNIGIKSLICQYSVSTQSIDLPFAGLYNGQLRIYILNI